MNSYTQTQIDDLIDYVSFCVKEGYLDSDIALDLIMTKDWKAIDKMRDEGDAHANEPEYQEKPDAFHY